MIAPVSIEPKAKFQTVVEKQHPYYDLIIIGGGPAGLTAAIYAGRAKLRYLLVEKAFLGGLISTTFLIENYPGFPQGIPGTELGERFEEQAKLHGLEIVYGEVTKIKFEKDYKIVEVGNRKFDCKSIIIATGSQPKKLNVAGEEKFLGRGVSFCATCDGAFYKDKHVIVVGGGNSAIEEALFLTRYVKKISIVHRRNKLRADKILAEKALHEPKIFILWHTTIEKIIGSEKVERVQLKDIQANASKTINADGVFVYIGTEPNTKFIDTKINLSEEGYIITDNEMKSNVPGVFAAGDVRNHTIKQVVTACSDGAVAVYSAIKYIENLK